MERIKMQENLLGNYVGCYHMYENYDFWIVISPKSDTFVTQVNSGTPTYHNSLVSLNDWLLAHNLEMVF